MKARTKADREIREYIRYILDRHKDAKTDSYWEIQTTNDILDIVEKYYSPMGKKLWR